MQRSACHTDETAHRGSRGLLASPLRLKTCFEVVGLQPSELRNAEGMSTLRFGCCRDVVTEDVKPIRERAALMGNVLPLADPAA